ncbi:MAG: YlxR family protein [Actinobacteria bacterium]|nr:YlxR family protein [Actinomycetota bacterium]
MRRAHPIRTCVGCRDRSPKPELLRIVLRDGRIQPDRLASAPGRGAYVHPTAECVRLARRARAYSRAFRAADRSGGGSAGGPEAGPDTGPAEGAAGTARRRGVPDDSALQSMVATSSLDGDEMSAE